jgi:hypothetical protein
MNTTTIEIPEKLTTLLKTTASDLCDAEVREQVCYRAYEWANDNFEDAYYHPSPSTFLRALRMAEEETDVWCDAFDDATDTSLTYAKILYAKNNIVFDEEQRDKHFPSYSMDKNYTGTGVFDGDYLENKLLKMFIYDKISDIYVVLNHCPEANS